MKCLTFLLGSLLLCGDISTRADDGQIRLLAVGNDTLVQVLGDADDDWRIQTSSDLLTWSTQTELGTLLSGDSSAPTRSLGSLAGSLRFYRALKTDGLYDHALVRTISLTFTQANWQTRLTSGRTTGSNTLGALVLDNGATVPGVGARYKGNTSFQMAGAKKSLNIEIDFTNATADLMRYSTINLNNAAGDETIMREPLYFNVMQRYTVCPKGALAKLYINNEYWGVYSLVQNGDSDLIKEWFQSSDGDRWRAPNAGGQPGGGGGGRPPGGGGGGAFSSPLSALSWQGTNVATYKSYYELKVQSSSNAWENLVHAIDVLNNTPTDQLRDAVEDVLAVDDWLWFLAIENIFTDDDSYWNKGADYAFYYDPENGRIHPVEHDGNEAFAVSDVSLSPVQGATGTNRPVLFRLLPINELRQRYLAHMRTVLEESFHPGEMTSLINQFHALSVNAILADPKKNYTMAAYTNDLNSLKNFATNRYRFLTNHSELKPVPPKIVAVSDPPSPAAGTGATITAQIQPNAEEAIDSVWLWFRAGPTGKFTRTQMFDDGAHGDSAAGDGVYGAQTAGFLAGTKVRYYIEARSDNTAKAASFEPARAEQVTFSYRVTTSAGTTSPVIINELMTGNSTTLADPQGDFDDWIELRNVTGEVMDLTGHYLSDNPDNPRKWPFPDGTKIPAGGYLLVWADENGGDSPGLHANFKLSRNGEQVLLVDTDEHLNALLDSVTFGSLGQNRSYGRSSQAEGTFQVMTPTPGRANN